MCSVHKDVVMGNGHGIPLGKCSCPNEEIDVFSLPSTPEKKNEVQIAKSNDPYAMVAKGSQAEASLIAAGWVMTDDYPNGWRHYEPGE
jgi:hypothetical protein